MPTADHAEQARLNAANVDYIVVPAVRDAYRLLLAEAEARSIETSVLASGDGKTLRFYRDLGGQRSYFFSCDRARAHLRCYVCPPSLRERPGLRRLLLDDPALETVEADDEVQVVVRDPEQCLHLVEMMFDRAEGSTGSKGQATIGAASISSLTRRRAPALSIGVQKGPPLSSGVTGMAGVPFALVGA